MRKFVENLWARPKLGNEKTFHPLALDRPTDDRLRDFLSFRPFENYLWPENTTVVFICIWKKSGVFFFIGHVSPHPSPSYQWRRSLRRESGSKRGEGWRRVVFLFVFPLSGKVLKNVKSGTRRVWKCTKVGLRGWKQQQRLFTKINLFSFSLELWLWRFCPSCIFRSNCIREFDAFGWLLLFFYITHTNASTSRAESDFRSTFWKSRSAAGKGKHGLSFSCLLNFNEGKNRRHAPANLFSGWKCLFTYFSRGGWKNLF